MAHPLGVELPPGADQPAHLLVGESALGGGKAEQLDVLHPDPPEPLEDRKRVRVLGRVAVVERDHDRLAGAERDATRPVGPQLVHRHRVPPRRLERLHLLRELVGGDVQARERRSGRRRVDHVVHQDRHRRIARHAGSLGGRACSRARAARGAGMSAATCARSPPRPRSDRGAAELTAAGLATRSPRRRQHHHGQRRECERPPAADPLPSRALSLDAPSVHVPEAHLRASLTGSCGGAGRCDNQPMPVELGAVLTPDGDAVRRARPRRRRRRREAHASPARARLRRAGAYAAPPARRRR